MDDLDGPLFVGEEEHEEEELVDEREFTQPDADGCGDDAAEDRREQQKREGQRGERTAEASTSTAACHQQREAPQQSAAGQQDQAFRSYTTVFTGQKVSSPRPVPTAGACCPPQQPFHLNRRA